MSDKIFLGRSVAKLDTSPAFDAYSKVVVIVGEDEDGEQLAYEAGNDSGLTLEVENPWGTQEIANSILAQISGYAYQPFTAAGALLDPAAELGDAITVSGVYSVLASQDISFGPLTASDIAAPAGGEIDHEYGAYQSSATRQLERKIATNRTSLTVQNGLIQAEVARATEAEGTLTSRITMTAESITEEVTRATSAEDTLSSRIAMTAESITAEVTRATAAEGDLASRITQTADSITAEVSRATTVEDGITTTLSQTVRLAADGITITNAQGSTLAIDGGQIKAESITGDKIVANVSLTAPFITGGTIQGGRLNVTGDGAKGGPALYIYDGMTETEDGRSVPGNLVGYLSYDNNGAGTDEEAKNRVMLTTFDAPVSTEFTFDERAIEYTPRGMNVHPTDVDGGEAEPGDILRSNQGRYYIVTETSSNYVWLNTVIFNTALKLRSSGNMSFEAKGGLIYFKTKSRFAGGLICDSYGTHTPYGTPENGQLYFQILEG